MGTAYRLLPTAYCCLPYCLLRPPYCLMKAVESGLQIQESQAASTADQAGKMLFDFWYPALLSRALRGQKLLKATLLGQPLVLGRDANGHAFAMKDICPHRGIPLS